MSKPNRLDAEAWKESASEMRDPGPQEILRRIRVQSQLEETTDQQLLGLAKMMLDPREDAGSSGFMIWAELRRRLEFKMNTRN